jgi:hypothetical protein
MDNKQDRQFYWEVKQFLNNGGPKETVSKAKPSIKDAISSVVNENKVFKQNNFSNETSLQKVVPSYLYGLIKAEKGFQPSCKAYTSNNTVNPFNITEEKNNDEEMDQDQTMSPRNSVYDRGRGGSMVAGRMPGYLSGQVEGSSNLMSPAELERLEKLTKINADAQDRMARQQATRDALRAQRAQDRLSYLERELEHEDLVQYKPEYSEEDRKNLSYEQMMTKIGSAGRKALEKRRAKDNYDKAVEYLNNTKYVEPEKLKDLDDKTLARMSFAHSAYTTTAKSAGYMAPDGPASTDYVDQIRDELRKRMQGQQETQAKAKAEADLDKPISPAYRTTRRVFKDTFGQDFNSSTENMQRLQALEAGNKDAVGGWKAVGAHRETLGAMVDDAKAAERTANVDAIKSEGEYLRFKQDPNYRKQQIAADTKKIKETEAFKRQMAEFRREMGITEAVSNILNKKKINEGIADTINAGLGSFIRGTVNLGSNLLNNEVTQNAKANIDAGLESLGLRKTEEQKKEEENKRFQEALSREEKNSNIIRDAGREIGRGVSQTVASAAQTLKDTAPKPVQGVDASDETTDKAIATSGVLKTGDVMKAVGNLVGGNIGSTISDAGSSIVRGALGFKNTVYGDEVINSTPELLSKDSNNTNTPPQGSNTTATPSLLERDPNVPTPPAEGPPAPSPTPVNKPSAQDIKAGMKAVGNVLKTVGGIAGDQAGSVVSSAGQALSPNKKIPSAQQSTSKPKPESQYRPGMTNINIEKQRRLRDEKQRQFNNRQPGRGNGVSMLQQGMQMASRYGVNPMSQLGAGNITLPSALNIPFRTLGQFSQQNLSGFAMSRGSL